MKRVHSIYGSARKRIPAGARSGLLCALQIYRARTKKARSLVLGSGRKMFRVEEDEE